MLLNGMSSGLASDLKKQGNAVLLVNSQRQIAGVSANLVKIWHLPEVIIRSQSDELALRVASNQFDNPQSFLRDITDIYANLELELCEIIQLRDGRKIERHSKPLWVNQIYVGRMWVFQVFE